MPDWPIDPSVLCELFYSDPNREPSREWVDTLVNNLERFNEHLEEYSVHIGGRRYSDIVAASHRINQFPQYAVVIPAVMLSRLTIQVQLATTGSCEADEDGPFADSCGWGIHDSELDSQLKWLRDHVGGLLVVFPWDKTLKKCQRRLGMVKGFEKFNARKWLTESIGGPEVFVFPEIRANKISPLKHVVEKLQQLLRENANQAQIELSNSSTTSPDGMVIPGRHTPYIFRRHGANFRVQFEGESGDIPVTLFGARYVYKLLQQPTKPIAAIDLHGGVRDCVDNAANDAHDQQEAIDALENDATRIAKEISEARKSRDTGRIERLLEDLQQIKTDIQSRKGLGGRPRSSESNPVRSIARLFSKQLSC